MAGQQNQRLIHSEFNLEQTYKQANSLYHAATKKRQHQYLDDAYHLAMKAHQQQPDYLPIINLLARIELKRQAYSQSWVWIRLGLSLKPKSASLLYSAGHLALAEHHLALAETYFKKSLSISKTATRAESSLAQVYLLQQEYVSAFQAYRQLARTQSNNPQIKANLFLACSHIQADFYAADLEQDLLDYLNYEQVDYSLLAPLTTSLLKHKFRLSEQGCPLELEVLIQDELLQKALTRFYFCDALMERLLLTLRQSILFASASELAIEQVFIPFVAALAQQTQLNEGVYYISEQEESMLEQLNIMLQKMLQQPYVSGQDLYPILLLLLMYQPLEQLSCFTELATMPLSFPPVLQHIMHTQLKQTQHEQRLEQNMPTLGKIENHISQAVQEQYIRHPYPRWQTLGEHQKSQYAQALELHFPKHNWQALKQQKIWQVLVAGCGTGRHALTLAKHFYDLQITAIDLSPRSLAYAQHKAQQLNVDNIQFYQADILGLTGHHQYQLIETSGVLHHMQSPQAGLNALVKQLAPGGVIKIGLYSKMARQQISQLREQIKQEMPKTEAQIRLMREVLLQGQLAGEYADILRAPDFYSLSGCRDLLFHTQEHLFTIPQLIELVAQAKLQWLGFLPPASAYQQAQNMFAKQPHQLNHQQWIEMETAEPDLFAGMYQFYASKPAP